MWWDVGLRLDALYDEQLAADIRGKVERGAAQAKSEAVSSHDATSDAGKLRATHGLRQERDEQRAGDRDLGEIEHVKSRPRRETLRNKSSRPLPQPTAPHMLPPPNQTIVDC